MLKLLLVGYGNMGKVHERAIENSNKALLYGIVDPKVSQLKMVACKRYSLCGFKKGY